MRDGITGLFRRRQSKTADIVWLEPSASAESAPPEAPPIESAPIEAAPIEAASAEPAVVESVAEPVQPVAPPDDFKFPWTRPEVAQETFASVDEALPKAEAPPDAEAAETESVEARESKRGFFARLFTRGSREEQKPLSVEVYQDRIEAATNALDAATETAFTPGRDTLPTSEEAFDSVEDALPVIENVPPVVEDALRVVDDTLPAIEVAPPTAREEALLSPADPFAETLDPVVPPPVIEQLEVRQTTDEFEILPTEPEAEAEDEEEPAVDHSHEHKIDTLAIEKKSIWSDSFVGKLFRRGATEVEKVGAKEQEAAEGSAVFLLAKFRAFYNEIIRFKHQKSEFAAGFATAILEDNSAETSPELAAEGLSKRLTELLELQVAEAKWMGGEVALRYPDAQYAMAALADEVFSNLEWEGQLLWAKYSIERKLYQSSAADVEVFRRMDRLLKEAPDSVIARDLARVYLLIIAAGFRGKYRPFGLTRALAEYRRRLYEYVHNGDPLMLYAPERTIFPDAASRTLAGQALSRFSAAQRWTALLVLLAVTYTVIAHFAWNRASADLKDVTSRIKSANVSGAR